MNPRKVAWVTGAGKRRVGAHVADALANRGYALVIPRQPGILIAGAAAAVAIAAGVFLFVRNRTAHGEAETTGSDTTGGSAVRVRVVTPSRGGVEGTVTRPGSVHAFQYAHLFAKVAGYLHNQTVDIGYRVQ